MKKDKRSSLGGKKRTQRDYNLGFKLAIVEQVEKGDYTYKQAQNKYGIQGRSTVLTWLRKHGKLDWSRPSLNFRPMPKSQETPAQIIKRLEKQLDDQKMRTIILEKMIEISDRDFGTNIRKKYLSEQQENSNKSVK